MTQEPTIALSFSEGSPEGQTQEQSRVLQPNHKAGTEVVRELCWLPTCDTAQSLRITPETLTYRGAAASPRTRGGPATPRQD